MASLWGELKRRNVVRVAIAYVIVSWLILQLTDVLVSLLSLPEWVGRFVFLLLLIGLPLALVFSWAFEITPEGLKKEQDVDRSQSITHLTGRKLDFVIIGVLGAALVVFAYERFVLLPARAPVAEIATTEVQHSIAVLPFVNMSADPDQEYFSDGLAEELLILLTKIPELKVIGRTSSFAFKGKSEDLRVIGQKLGVKSILEGSVRKSGNNLRITAQLIDASDASYIWSETYTRTLTDIFAIQDDVAAAIIDALQLHVGKNPSRGRPTGNSEAYTLFLKARASLNATKRRAAEDFAKQAIALDPDFAEAWELLGDIYWHQAGAELSAAEAQERVGEAAAKALAINPNLVYARVMYELGNVKTYSFLREIKALELALGNPRSRGDALNELSFDLMVAGYLREAVGLAEQMVELEPLSPIAHIRWFDALYAAGRTSEAMATLEVIDQLNPGSAHWYVFAVNLLANQDDIAVARFEAFVEQDGLPSDWVRDLLSGARDPVTGAEFLDRRIPEIVATMPAHKASQWQRYLSYWYLFLGYLDRFFDAILAAGVTDSHWTDGQNLVYAGIKWRLGFTAHPRFIELAEQLGIIDVWENRGPPDFCDKVSGEWNCE